MVLSNGVEIPAIGFGTADMQESDVERSVKVALESGCYFIDTAYVYQSERAVGNAIRAYLSHGGAERKDIFIQTKFYPQMPYGYKQLMEQFTESLKNLQVEYVDAYLIHQPVPRYGELEYRARNTDVWKAMEELYGQGKARAIGVSNFLERHIMQLEEKCSVRPMINQMEINPVFQQRGLSQWCRERGIVVQGWGSLRHGELNDDGDGSLQSIAESHHVSVAQICLRWNMQMGNIPIFASRTASHIAENLSLSFDLTEEEMEQIRQKNTSTDHRKTWWYPRQQMY